MDPSSAADRRYTLRRLEAQMLDTRYFDAPVDFETALARLRPAQWPPSEEHAAHLAHLCNTMLHSLFRWEADPAGDGMVRDVRRGEITSAEARRLLAHHVAVSDEGDVTVLLCASRDEAGQDSGAGELRIELRAFVDEERSLPGQQLLGRPEIVVAWSGEDDEGEWVELPTTRRGGAWYALEQLRDDLREGRLKP